MIHELSKKSNNEEKLPIKISDFLPHPFNPVQFSRSDILNVYWFNFL